MFEVNDVIVGFELTSGERDQVILVITLEVPEGRSVQLIDRSVQVEGSSPPGTKAELSGRQWVSAGRSGEISLAAPMQGKTQRGPFKQITPYGRTKYAYYFIRAEVSETPSEQFLLDPPRLLVNGVPVDLPPVTFSKTVGHVFIGLNC